VTKVFAFGLAVFCGAFLLAMVLSLGLIFTTAGGFTAAQPLEYLAVAVLLAVPLYGVWVAFGELGRGRTVEEEHPVAMKAGFVLLALGLLGLYTRITVNPGGAGLSAVEFAGVLCLLSGSLLLWKFRHH
jgi:hypothetical protein